MLNKVCGVATVPQNPHTHIKYNITAPLKTEKAPHGPSSVSNLCQWHLWTRLQQAEGEVVSINPLLFKLDGGDSGVSFCGGVDNETHINLN